MKVLIRSLTEQRELWRIWTPLLFLTMLVPLPLIGMPLIEKQLVDSVFLKHQANELLGMIAAYAGLWFGATLLGTGKSTLQTYFGERMTQRLRLRLLRHSGALSLAFWNREHSGRTMVLFYSDVPRLASIFNMALVGGAGGVVGSLASAYVMFSLNWQLAIVTAFSPVIVSCVGFVVTRPLRPIARRVQEKASELNQRLEENLTGVREIIAFGREESQSRQFAATLQDLLRLTMRLTLINSAFSTGQSAFSLAVFAAILGYGGYLVLHGYTTLGTLIAMRGLYEQTFSAARQLFGLARDTQTSLASADRVFAFLDEVPSVQDQPTARSLSRVSGTIEFQNVGFAYQPGQPVLNNVSLRARAGQVIALVGPSGAGKSTLMSLLSRFYDPTEGSILLDGLDLREIKLSSLRRQIGIVFQDTFLFASTIRENIAFGRQDASEEEIVAAAKAANAWEFIEKLPKGLDTPVGQRGAQLSEGQKQRISIARALLRDPRILILDEPTSALDARAESLLQSALHRLMHGRTTFVIAHRLATVKSADSIVVIDHGQVVEQGTHSELLQRHGLYRELYGLQTAALEPAFDRPALEPVALLAPGVS